MFVADLHNDVLQRADIGEDISIKSNFGHSDLLRLGEKHPLVILPISLLLLSNNVIPSLSIDLLVEIKPIFLLDNLFFN